MVARNLREVPGGVTWRWDPRLRAMSPYRLSEEQVEAFLKRIRCPALAVRARNGLSFDAWQRRSRHASIADLTVVDVDGGHHAHLDSPEIVAAVVSPFLLRR